MNLRYWKILLVKKRIYIPKTNKYEDLYGVAKYYDSTYEYLKSCGIKDIEKANGGFMRIDDAIRLPF